MAYTEESIARQERFNTHSIRPLPVWKPDVPAEQIPMNIYRNHVNAKFRLHLKDSHELHEWSVTEPHAFWIDLWGYVDLMPKLPSGIQRAYNPDVPISKVPPFFDGATVNYAENVLTQPLVDPQSPALVGLREGQNLDGEVWSWAVLRENVRRVRSALLRSGIKQGDRVAALVSTSVWSVALLLGAASIGAIFTSIAPDLGLEVCQMPPEYYLTFSDRCRDAFHDCNRCNQQYYLLTPTQRTKVENDPTPTRFQISSRSSTRVHHYLSFPRGAWRPLSLYQSSWPGPRIETRWNSPDSRSQLLYTFSTPVELQDPQNVLSTAMARSYSTRR